MEILNLSRLEVPFTKSQCGRYLIVKCRNKQQAIEKATEERDLWAVWAAEMKCLSTRFVYGKRKQDYTCVLASMASDNPGSYNTPQVQPNSYGASRLSAGASYAEVMDFIAGQRASGNIVTVMSMNDRNPAKNDLFLSVNDLQIQHRAGGWRMNDWVGTDAKSTVWVRSFDGTLPRTGSREAGHNYYQELVQRIKSGQQFIQGFEYLIDRPNNAGLWLDVTDYHFVEDFGGCAARVAVSRTTDSTLVEAYQA